MTQPAMAAKDVLGEVQSRKVEFIHLQFTDVVGIVKGVTIPVNQLEVALDRGVWFDGSSIQGFARIAESDMYLVPDPTTFAVIPWETQDGPATARLICDVYTPAGQPFAGDPRRVLGEALARAAARGYAYNCGPELEFFLFRNGHNGAPHTEPQDEAGYFDYSTDEAVSVRKQMVAGLQAFGIVVEAGHHESAPGQHEIDFQYADALTAADNAITFKYVLKAVARRNGLHATFMPKPIHGIAGSGMHTHQSLCDVTTGHNVFADGDDRFGLSQVARCFIAGQLAHARGMCALLAPLVNSYKRLVPGYEAPVYVSWARTNRSALIRVPRVSNREATRLELRCPDPSCNPYLAFAVMLSAGLQGIDEAMAPPEPEEEDLYSMDEAERRAHHLETLPGSLAEALALLAADQVVRRALGEHVYQRFVEAKRQEWDEYRLQVTPWEVERYLRTY
ncbi:MAG TPA: type I glutamate--ammonia ligase [Anaerolineae bacterium]|nr:type I glutamate--ammonia ligase [Anaerolineae bacterium]HOQ99912.1 type I glutamate--ammonia ligase [Anaerolineae bacterium]HPL29308.1 type I glutamate--ammonia ligase [Anaerolineae bacterium]